MRNNNKKQSNVIPLKPDFDESKLQYIKHKIVREENGVRDETEQKVPSLPTNATAYQKLMFFESFARARAVLGWTSGQKLYTKFPMHLNMSNLRSWTTIVGDKAQTVNNFNQDLTEFKRKLLSGYKYHTQMDFLRNVRKPREISPLEFQML